MFSITTFIGSSYDELVEHLVLYIISYLLLLFLNNLFFFMHLFESFDLAQIIGWLRGRFRNIRRHWNSKADHNELWGGFCSIRYRWNSKDNDCNKFGDFPWRYDDISFILIKANFFRKKTPSDGFEQVLRIASFEYCASSVTDETRHIWLIEANLKF